MKAVDLFSGGGGLSLGLQQAGMTIVGAFENWLPARRIYAQNFSHPVYDIDLSDIEKAVPAIQALAPDLIAGGPPCQDFSSAGKRDETLGRAYLTVCYAHIIDQVAPTWFLMENVARAAGSDAFQQAKKTLSRTYGLTEQIIDASLCGVPQKRKRLFLIGKKGEKDHFLSPSLLSGLAARSLTVKEALGDTIRTPFYYRHARSYARRAIFSIDEASPTIRGVNRPIPPGYTIHQGDATRDLSHVRALTSHERALIQTFPPTFQWQGVNKSVLEQIIGNAVPVKLAQYVGERVITYDAASLSPLLPTDDQTRSTKKYAHSSHP